MSGAMPAIFVKVSGLRFSIASTTTSPPADSPALSNEHLDEITLKDDEVLNREPVE